MTPRIALLTLSLFCSAHAAESDFMRAYQKQRKHTKETPTQTLQQHAEGSQKIAREQDELSADVQELIQLETEQKVISFLEEAEELMAHATDKLEEKNTSGATIAIETEIIEKIAEAAQQKQQKQQQQGQQNGALMQMLQQMMQGSQKGQGEQETTSGGEGQEGESNTANDTTPNTDSHAGSSETRRLPRKSGSAGSSIPKEFQKALDAYNKSLNTP